MIGPLPTAPGGFNRVLVAIDKFTKWIEVKPVTCPKANRVLDFLDELVHRYGLPHRITTSSGSTARTAGSMSGTSQSPTPGMVLDALKKRRHDAANTKWGKWIKELPNALWELRTQPTKPTGQSPYFLVYGFEAILPADIMLDSSAVEQYDEGISEDSRRVNIDGLDEARCASLVVWTSLGPLPRWVPGPTTRWAPGTTRLPLHDTCWREAQGLQRRSTRIGSCTCPALYRGLLDVLD
jgi:hypothetical protein